MSPASRAPTRRWLVVAGFVLMGAVGCRDRRAASSDGGCAAPAEEATAAVPKAAAGDASVPRRRARCERPLAEYCRAGPCPSYEPEVAELRALVAAYKDAGACLVRARIGTSGGRRFVMSSDGYTGHTTYFDDAGRLVGAEGWSDTNAYCEGEAYSASYGVVPGAEAVVVEDLCAGTWSPPGL